ncbi:MAG: type I-E CRISPR-associated protein Cas5/CasD [Spongiibacteraceae bacterium]|nr:type I-E CRISPR-associated protein Cas5/CasD [Spongiibacteraceae bacterium]
MDYLLFRLYGPMASWGDIAVGESRHSAVKPTKSALLGLLGASLGLKRDDNLAQQALAEGYHFAIHVVSVGQLLKDYHTTQAPDSVGKFQYRTRCDELVIGKHRLGTVLSNREYRTNALAIVAVRALPDAKWSIHTLQQALVSPKYHLYLGRKSCPLAAPLQAEIITANNYRQALRDYQAKTLIHKLSAWDSQEHYLPADAVQGYYWEGCIEDFSARCAQFIPEQVQQLRQYDQPLSRERWQFQPRQEYFWQAPAQEEN